MGIFGAEEEVVKLSGQYAQAIGRIMMAYYKLDMLNKNDQEIVFKKLATRERDFSNRYISLKKGNGGAGALRDWRNAQRELVVCLMVFGLNIYKLENFTFFVDRGEALHVFSKAV